MKLVLRRLVLPAVLFFIWAPAAQAWSWPVQGPVLQPFVYDEAHPYDAGQHRGIDIGADAAGQTVIAPAAGTASFAGTVPTSGKCVTIQTPDGYSVTLTHLGSILVAKGATVGEGDAVGTIGPSGTPEFDQPYLHLGIRTTADPNGYLDPLSFLPATASEPAQTETTSQPTTSSAPASPGAARRQARTRGSHSRTTQTRPSSHRGGGRGSQSRSVTAVAGESSTAARNASRSARGQRSSQGPASHFATLRSDNSRHSPMPHRGLSEPTNSWHRPVVEVAAPGRTSLGAGRAAVPGAPRTHLTEVVLPPVIDGLAALVAVAAAFAAARRRRKVVSGSFTAGEIARLSPPRERGRVRAAA